MLELVLLKKNESMISLFPTRGSSYVSRYPFIADNCPNFFLKERHKLFMVNGLRKYLGKDTLFRGILIWGIVGVVHTPISVISSAGPQSCRATRSIKINYNQSNGRGEYIEF